jgi:hypothetical protein
MRLHEACAFPDPLEIVDEIFEPKLAVWHRRCAMSAQIIADHSEMVGQHRDDETPGVPRRADAVDHEQMPWIKNNGGPEPSTV